MPPDHHDVFAPPDSSSPYARQERGHVPASVLKDIRNGGICAIISSSITVVVYVLARGQLDPRLETWIMFEVVLLVGCTIGTFLKSRIATTALFGYFVFSKILGLVQGDSNIAGLALAGVFIYFYFKAMRASYQYHQLVGRGSYSTAEAASPYHRRS